MAFVVGHAQIDPAKTVLTINGEDIKGNEYYRKMQFLPGVGKPIGTSFAEFTPGFLTLEQLITERLLLQLAREKGVFPSEVELNAEVANRSQDDPKLVADWKASGRTEAELRAQIQLDLVQFKLQTSGITITDQQVEGYYNANKDEFTSPVKLKLRVIAVPDIATRDAAEAELKAAKPFSEVASKYSGDVSKVNGGDYGIMPITMFSPAFKAAIASLKPGQSTEWVATGSTYVKFLVENSFPAVLEPLTPALRRSIRKKIMIQRGSVKNNLQADMRAARLKAAIDIKEPEFAKTYRKYIELYFDEKKSGG